MIILGYKMKYMHKTHFPKSKIGLCKGTLAHPS